MIIAATSCSIPKTTLIATPFSLAWGVSVFARVVAVNIVGSSPVSSVGNGAYIQTYPASPINFANNPSVTSASQIGLTWSPSTFTGGVPVIDYAIIYDNGLANNVYIPVQSGITTTSFTVVGLSVGKTYNFQIRSRTSFGFSDYSNPISILAA